MSDGEIKIVDAKPVETKEHDKEQRGSRILPLQIEKENWKPPFSVADNFGLKFIRAVSRKGLAVKIILSLLAFNFYQLME